MITPTVVDLTQTKHGVAVINLHTPGASQNTLSSATLEALNAALDQIAANENSLGVIIRSTQPGSFIAGVNLFEFHDIVSDTPENARARFVQVSGFGRQVLQRLRNFRTAGGVPLPTVALIEAGACYGAGLELACSCDMRVALKTDVQSERVRFRMPEAALAFVADWGGTYLLPRLIGVLPALDFLLHPLKEFSARDAFRLGLVDVVTPRNVGPDMALFRAEQLVLNPLSRRKRPNPLTRGLGRWLDSDSLWGKLSRISLRLAYRAGIRCFGPRGSGSDGLRASLGLVLASVGSTDEACQKREAASGLRLAMAPGCKAMLDRFVKAKTTLSVVALLTDRKDD